MERRFRKPPTYPFSKRVPGHELSMTSMASTEC